MWLAWEPYYNAPCIQPGLEGLFIFRKICRGFLASIPIPGGRQEVFQQVWTIFVYEGLWSSDPSIFQVKSTPFYAHVNFPLFADMCDVINQAINGVLREPSSSDYSLTECRSSSPDPSPAIPCCQNKISNSKTRSSCVTVRIITMKQHLYALRSSLITNIYLISLSLNSPTGRQLAWNTLFGYCREGRLWRGTGFFSPVPDFIQCIQDCTKCLISYFISRHEHVSLTISIVNSKAQWPFSSQWAYATTLPFNAKDWSRIHMHSFFIHPPFFLLHLEGMHDCSGETWSR